MFNIKIVKFWSKIYLKVGKVVKIPHIFSIIPSQKGSVKVGKLVNLGNLQSSPSKMTCPKFWLSYLKVGTKLLTTSKPFEDQTTNQISASHRYSRYGVFQPFAPKEYASNPVFYKIYLCRDSKTDVS